MKIFKTECLLHSQLPNTEKSITNERSIINEGSIITGRSIITERSKKYYK